jgi:hypothetical protein
VNTKLRWKYEEAVSSFLRSSPLILWGETGKINTSAPSQYEVQQDTKHLEVRGNKKEKEEGERNMERNKEIKK